MRSFTQIRMEKIDSVQNENGPKIPDWELVHQYNPLLKSIVHRMMPYFRGYGSYGEVYSTGLWGLISAAQHFEFRFHGGFAAYAKIRIYGALWDELRKSDARFRRVRGISRLAPSNSSSENVTEQKPTPTLVSLDALGSEEGEQDGGEILSDLTSPNGREVLEHGESIRFLREEYAKLPPRPRKLFSLYYFSGFRFSEIASLWGITESRVCQIHSRMVRFLKFKMVKVFFGKVQHPSSVLSIGLGKNFSAFCHSCDFRPLWFHLPGSHSWPKQKFCPAA